MEVHIISNVYDGFDEYTVHLHEMEVMPVDRMPDETISVDEMKEYGYAWGGMLPMREEAAAEIGKDHTICRLYGDDTEGMVMDMSEIKEHAAQGGIFGKGAGAVCRISGMALLFLGGSFGIATLVLTAVFSCACVLAMGSV